MRRVISSCCPRSLFLVGLSHRHSCVPSFGTGRIDHLDDLHRSHTVLHHFH